MLDVYFYSVTASLGNKGSNSSNSCSVQCVRASTCCSGSHHHHHHMIRPSVRPSVRPSEVAGERAEGDDWGRPYPSGDRPLFIFSCCCFRPRTWLHGRRRGDGLWLIIFRFAGGASVRLLYISNVVFNVKERRRRRRRRRDSSCLCWDTDIAPTVRATLPSHEVTQTPVRTQWRPSGEGKKNKKKKKKKRKLVFHLFVRSFIHLRMAPSAAEEMKCMHTRNDRDSQSFRWATVPVNSRWPLSI